MTDPSGSRRDVALYVGYAPLYPTQVGAQQTSKTAAEGLVNRPNDDFRGFMGLFRRRLRAE
jgi:hypothetical protein